MPQKINKSLLLAGLIQNAVGTPESQRQFAQIINSVLRGREQKSFDERRFVQEDLRATRTASAENARLNTSLGLPPGTSQEQRAQFIAQQGTNQKFTEASEFAAGIAPGAVAENVDPQDALVAALRQRAATLPQGNPQRQAIEQRLQSIGASLERPEAPPVGTEGQTGVQSVQPVERFQQLKEITEREELAATGAKARAGRAGPEEIREIETVKAEVAEEFAGPAGADEPNQFQATALGALIVAVPAVKELNKAMEGATFIAGRFTGGIPGSDFSQNFDLQSRVFTNAVLRLESGAAITPAERDLLLANMPQRNDTRAQIERKKIVQANVIKSIRVKAGKFAPEEDVTEGETPEGGDISELSDEELLKLAGGG